MSIKPEDLARLCEALGVGPQGWAYEYRWRAPGRKWKTCTSRWDTEKGARASHRDNYGAQWSDDANPTSDVFPYYPPLDNDLAVEMVESAHDRFGEVVIAHRFTTPNGERLWKAWVVNFEQVLKPKYPEAVAAALLAALDAGAFE